MHEIFEFCNIIVEHQVRTRVFGFYCPFVNFDNASKANSVDILGGQILRLRLTIYL